MQIEIIHQPDETLLKTLGVETWPIWEKEVSTFPWTYDADETCYILEGHVRVTSAQGDSIELKAGDLVTFPKGLSCTWEVLAPVRKHYRFT